MRLRVRVIPKASRSEVVGWEEDPVAGRVLRVRVAAPPVEGKANAALRALLASWLDLPKSRIRLEKGETSRIKTLELPEVAIPELPH